MTEYSILSLAKMIPPFIPRFPSITCVLFFCLGPELLSPAPTFFFLSAGFDVSVKRLSNSDASYLSLPISTAPFTLYQILCFFIFPSSIGFQKSFLRRTFSFFSFFSFSALVFFPFFFPFFFFFPPLFLWNSTDFSGSKSMIVGSLPSLSKAFCTAPIGKPILSILKYFVYSGSSFKGTPMSSPGSSSSLFNWLLSDFSGSKSIIPGSLPSR
mmetsp:Transcript_32436/g.43143  ORF Transcript_32436/g.43143 Transcript_32436/m.43143 type:complete len:212 (-) Transcript_32436:132-767(-)